MSPVKSNICSIKYCTGITGVPGTARGFCSSHYHRWQRHADPLGGGRAKLGYPDNLFAGCDRSGGPDTCWPWLSKPGNSGYATVSVGDYKQAGAHVAMYEYLVGPISSGLELDHLCRNRICVNPAHLEPVTGIENMKRARIANGSSQNCKRGHPRADNNWYIHPNGSRECLTCRHGRERARRAS